MDAERLYRLSRHPPEETVGITESSAEQTRYELWCEHMKYGACDSICLLVATAIYYLYRLTMEQTEAGSHESFNVSSRLS